MTFARVIDRTIQSFCGWKLQKRIRRNGAKLAKMRPDLARLSGRWTVARSRRKPSEKIHRAAVHTMTDLLRG